MLIRARFCCRNLARSLSSKFKLAIREAFLAKLSGLVVSSQVMLFNTKLNVIHGFVNTIKLKSLKLVLGLTAESLSGDIMDICHSFEICNETTVFGLAS